MALLGRRERVHWAAAGNGQSVMLVAGVHLPDSEVHFRETLETLAREGRSTLYPVLAAALPLVTAHRRAIDIGAHVGLWSRWLVDRFLCVEAFEPVAEHAELFRRNVRRGYTLHEVALGCCVKRVGMKPFPHDTGRAHVHGDGEILMTTLD